MVVVDSTVWVDVLRAKGSPYAAGLRSLVDRGLARVTGIVRAEILPFVKPGRERRLTDELLARLPRLDIDPADRLWERIVERRTQLVAAGLGDSHCLM